MDRFGTLSAALRRLLRDRRGLAALEYALIAPMMLAILFVSVDMVDAVGAAKRTENTAASLADVVARDILVTDAELDDILAAAPFLMFPTPEDQLSVRITSVLIDAGGAPSVVWSEGTGALAAHASGVPFDLPVRLREPNTSVVVAEAATAYRPPLGLFSSDPLLLERTAYRRSRIVDPVAREGV